jgi:hypothetical protein
MRATWIMVLPVLLVMSGACIADSIICGAEPGEIYFGGVTSTGYGNSGFYYSLDYGEHIELRDSSQSGYGSLFPDAQHNTLYMLGGYPVYPLSLSINGGYSWEVVNPIGYTYIYASGVISGEIYRRIEDSRTPSYERSTDYGENFMECSCEGIPDSIYTGVLGLGSDSGEVYAWCSSGSERGLLYYSSDYGEHFTFLTDTEIHWATPRLLAGAESGEVFVYDAENQKICRIWAYGDSLQLIAHFNFNSSWGGFASYGVPGGLYFYTYETHMVPGGDMYILHTQDYFQTWDMYEHIRPPTGVSSASDPNIVESFAMQIYPNPANAAFHISYDIYSSQNVQFAVYNLLGQLVWQRSLGFHPSGRYQLNFTNEQLSSGTYLLQLSTEKTRTVKTITIVK